MSDVPAEDPPWVWDRLPEAQRNESWRELVEWVDWLTDAYAPWIVLPDCWPAHEGLRTELTMFWLWHEWLMTAAVNPIDGVRWHQDLRHSAQAWRELANCRHEPPIGHHENIRAAQRARRDQFIEAVRGAPLP